MILITSDGVTGLRYIVLLRIFFRKSKGLGSTLTKKSLIFSAIVCLSSITDQSDYMNLVCLFWSLLFLFTIVLIMLQVFLMLFLFVNICSL